MHRQAHPGCNDRTTYDVRTLGSHKQPIIIFTLSFSNPFFFQRRAYYTHIMPNFERRHFHYLTQRFKPPRGSYKKWAVSYNRRRHKKTGPGGGNGVPLVPIRRHITAKCKARQLPKTMQPSHEKGLKKTSIVNTQIFWTNGDPLFYFLNVSGFLGARHFDAPATIFSTQTAP